MAEAESTVAPLMISFSMFWRVTIKVQLRA